MTLSEITPTEWLGFLTGGGCVWLVVRENVWNWPLGLANSALFFVLFFRSRLYADMALQAMFFSLNAYGWWNWLYGGTQHGVLRISNTRRFEWGALAVAIPVVTLAMRQLLIRVNDAAPALDAFTTALSVSAQYLQTRKRLEHWWIWILADVVYIPLYVSRKLPLTAVLYGIFLLMCVIGLRDWRRSFRDARL
jgi:nicotinamide mononucleotide transporter